MKGINLRFAVFIASIAAIIALRIVFEQYMLSHQKEDAHLIRLAGRQSMLIQKLVKISLSIEDDVEKNESNVEHVQMLKDVIREIELHHSVLTSFIQTKHSNDAIDSLLKSIDPSINIITQASSSREAEDIQKILQLIYKHDPTLSALSEQLVASYQRHADYKMDRLRTAHFFFGICVFMAIVFGFAYIVLPSIRQLRSGNRNLEGLNHELHEINTKLVQTEQFAQENLSKVQKLHDDLTLKENQYRKLIESSDNMIYELDENGQFIFVNPITEYITGFSKEELYRKLFWEIVHPNHKDAAIQFYFQQRKKKQEHSYYELPIVTAKRKTIWIGQSTSMYFLGNDDGLAKSSIISRDVTNFKMTQLKLENSEKLYRLISTNSRDLVSLYNYVEDTPIRTYVSPSVKDILGYTPDELIGKVPFDIMVPEDSERMKKTSHMKVMGGKSTRSEYRVYKKDGSIAWIEAFAEPFFDDAGKVIGFQTSARDITQRIENEAKINEVKEKAVQATLAKSQFLSMMSHEIRTPLNGIIGLTNFLLEDNPSQEHLKHLKLLKFSGDNLLTIINDVLDFSKIEANEIHLERISFNLKNMLENALQTLRIRATDKGLPLMFSYDSKLPDIVKGDPVRLSQIINNLVSNAIKFTEKGFVTVQALFTGKHEDKYSITFSVRDTGIGIPADKQSYIFESFTQATPDTARKFGGTGLGLSITKRLIQLMGNDIIVVSELGKGTEFTFSLNLEEAQVSDESVEYQTNYYEKTKEISILLVDDNDVNLIVASNYLKKWLFKVRTAENGKEALDLIAQKAFHLILMDLQMPEMDGYEASLKIREMSEPYFKEIPIIALTASAMIEDIERLSKVGITDFVSKPFNPQELHDKIMRYALPEVPGTLTETEFSLDAYSGGDKETANLLALRMVDNLKELQDALNQSVERKTDDLYRKSLHKMQTTLSIINDSRLMTNLELIKNLLGDQKEVENQLMAEVEQFTRQSNEHIIKLLEKVKTDS